jgi:DNA-binding GntR family transcriptional regulator
VPDPNRDPRRYVKLAGMLRQKIASGELAAGEPLPPISKLHVEYGHSRQTIGKAMKLLEGERLIYFVPGLGYYVETG